MVFKNKIDAQIVELIIEKKRIGYIVRVKEFKPNSKVYIVTVGGKELEEDKLEKYTGKKYKDIASFLGL